VVEGLGGFAGAELRPAPGFQPERGGPAVPLISFWLVDAVGWTLYVTTRTRGGPPPPVCDSSIDLSL
jgi:hypothetical protein